MKVRKIFFSLTIVFLFLATLILTLFTSLYLFSVELRIEDNLGNYYLTELITILFLGILIFCYKKTKKVKKRLFILSTTVGAISSLLIMYGLLLYFFLGISRDFTDKAQQAEKEFSVNQEVYIPLVTTIFDKAETRNVRHDIDIRYGGLLGYDVSCLDSINRQSKECYSGRRRPVYFIRLKDNKIEKLFQSGNIKAEMIDTDGERVVRDMLLGKVNPIEFPQYTCCGGNDLEWSDVPFFRIFVPERRYLKDFYSELETIFLIRDREGNIMGAMVSLYGD